MCLARAPFKVATHARVSHASVLGRVPIREYTDLYHTTNHTHVCETVWSILTSIKFHHEGTHGRVT
ncbi:Tumor necrosis factor receptor superfamily member 11B [Gossypium arboreum]|uniref:Tumor necrosis factor receptor superfamily member 11B n=1 Tax=Gossypium arboreum TaxID=29729 RepID=A0A0B0PTQ7_GOSAR|nr:Tumor necrosis factor receptor superfamily member 11B [Gossypium arboreum]